MHFIVELFANNLGQEILLDVTNPTIVSYIKIVGFGTGYSKTGPLTLSARNTHMCVHAIPETRTCAVIHRGLETRL